MTAPYDRRGFLRGLVSLPLIGGAGALTLARPAVAVVPDPDAALLALGAELDAVDACYRDAREAVARAVARFEAVEPPIPESLVTRAPRDWVATDWPPDAFGYSNASRVKNRTRIPDPYHLNERVRRLDGRTVAGREARQLKKLSDAFHEAHKAAREGAGVQAAERARFDAGRAVAAINVRVADAPAAGLAGLAVKGRSELAWLRVLADEGGMRTRQGLIDLFENMAALGAEGKRCA